MTSQMPSSAEASGGTIEFLRKENAMLRSLLEEVYAYNKHIHNELWKFRAKIDMFSPVALKARIADLENRYKTEKGRLKALSKRVK